jgi:uncharacterized pyridoxamine 5'-phosphate oxidase family protein
MTVQLTPEQVWQAIEKEMFAVIGMVNAQNQARTVGVVYVVRNRKLYIGTGNDSWKAKHIARNPDVSMTVAIPKQILFMPWIKIPAATITFAGKGRVLTFDEAPAEVLAGVFRGLEFDSDTAANSCLIEVTPVGDFITYGVGIPLLKMRNPDQARGRAPVAG